MKVSTLLAKAAKEIEESAGMREHGLTTVLDMTGKDHTISIKAMNYLTKLYPEQLNTFNQDVADHYDCFGWTRTGGGKFNRNEYNQCRVLALGFAAQKAKDEGL